MIDHYRINFICKTVTRISMKKMMTEAAIETVNMRNTLCKWLIVSLSRSFCSSIIFASPSTSGLPPNGFVLFKMTDLSFR